MRVSAVGVFAAILGAIAIFSAGGLGSSHPAESHPTPTAPPPGKLAIDYPSKAPFFLPKSPPPTLLFRDSSDATRWVVRVTFADHSPEIRMNIPREHFKIGEIDPRAGTPDEILDLTPQQKVTRPWKPDHDT